MRLKAASGPPAEGEWPAPIYSNQRYRRRRRRQYRDCSDIRRPSVIGRRLDWCLKEIEKRPADISDLPTRIVPSNKRGLGRARPGVSSGQSSQSH
jgi:hypothetical protein